MTISSTTTHAAIMGTNCPGYLLQADFQSLFDLNTDGDKQIDTHRRRYLSDRQVDGCQNTEGHQVISQRLADRQHNGNKYVHGGVGINKASRDQEDHIHDQKEGELVVCNASKQVGCRLCDTKLGTLQKRTETHWLRSA